MLMLLSIEDCLGESEGLVSEAAEPITMSRSAFTIGGLTSKDPSWYTIFCHLDHDLHVMCNQPYAL